VTCVCVLYVHICLCVYVCVRPCVYARVYTPVCVHPCVYVRVCVHVHVHTSMCVQLIVRPSSDCYKLKNCKKDVGEVVMRRQTWLERSGGRWRKNVYRLVRQDPYLDTNTDGTLAIRQSNVFQPFPLLIHYFQKKFVVHFCTIAVGFVCVARVIVCFLSLFSLSSLSLSLSHSELARSPGLRGASPSPCACAGHAPLANSLLTTHRCIARCAYCLR
jgi:hypothetical protein